MFDRRDPSEAFDMDEQLAYEAMMEEDYEYDEFDDDYDDVDEYTEWQDYMGGDDWDYGQCENPF